MNNIKDAHEFTEGKLERRTGGLEGWGFGWSAGDPHFHCTTLISN